MQKKRRLLPTYEIWMKVLRLPRYDPDTAACVELWSCTVCRGWCIKDVTFLNLLVV